MTIEKTSKTKYWLLAIIAIILDQVSKTAILNRFEYTERLNIIPNFFDLTLVYNTGAAFSFLADAGGWQKYFFLGLAAVISFYLARAIVKDDFGTWGKLGAAMVIGGAFGNVIDRLIHGHVVDFLLFYWKNWYYPAFNVADSFICVGAVMLVIDGFKHKKDDKQAV
ncbi:lipoprotein signal peptidase [Neisseria animaloris]|uniref:Lipoprotein signal peptidase n=1 Tax=Neisseria animaloris TaxID=326522 RepID=A0A1X3CJD5_9NEIS|nr:signal peptidase II [Neisseria animaloris]OSI07655.1 signal peptidase II [Neisseria animaloris]VEH88282.1 lipoprotein signal peptidase [Neisseria animaloris]VEJ21680.1 lipoprotein signal peptidase [Neisseria animaloris]